MSMHATTSPQIETSAKVRALFWYLHPIYKRDHLITDYSGTGKMYPTDVRTAFIDFVCDLYADGRISEQLRNTITLRPTERENGSTTQSVIRTAISVG